MTIFPLETLGLPSYSEKSERLMHRDGSVRFGGSVENTRRYGQDVRYHYERDHV